jgi:hypothetical protein
MNRFGEGVKRLGLIGSRVIVARNVGVNVGRGVFVIMGVSVNGVVVGARVFRMNKSGVLVESSEYGVTVGGGVLVGAGV